MNVGLLREEGGVCSPWAYKSYIKLQFTLFEDLYLKNSCHGISHFLLKLDCRVCGEVAQKSSHPKLYLPKPEKYCPEFLVKSPEMRHNSAFRVNDILQAR